MTRNKTGIIDKHFKNHMKIITVSLLLIFIKPDWVEATPVDSAAHKDAHASSLRIATRIHSMGLFSYGGRLVSGSPVLDINLNYVRKAWGFQLFKAIDLRDSSTPINFALAVVNKNFRLGKRITITPSVGFILEQFESIADHGSDAVVILTTAFKMSSHLTLEHSTMAGNLFLEPELRDWVNRIRLMYSINHLDLTLMGWHNNPVFDSSDYITVGASVFYSRLTVAQGVTLNVGITGLYVPYTSNQTGVPFMNGAFFTFGCSIN